MWPFSSRRSTGSPAVNSPSTRVTPAGSNEARRTVTALAAPASRWSRPWGVLACPSQRRRVGVRRPVGRKTVPVSSPAIASRAARACATASVSSASPAEHVAEDRLKCCAVGVGPSFVATRPTAAEWILGSAWWCRAARGWSACAERRGRAADANEIVVLPTLLSVRENLVGLLDLRELRGRILGLVSIGVVLQCQLAMRPANVVCACGTADPENVVEVTRRHADAKYRKPIRRERVRCLPMRLRHPA